MVPALADPRAREGRGVRAPGARHRPEAPARAAPPLAHGHPGDREVRHDRSLSRHQELVDASGRTFIRLAHHAERRDVPEKEDQRSERHRDREEGTPLLDDYPHAHQHSSVDPFRNVPHVRHQFPQTTLFAWRSPAPGSSPDRLTDGNSPSPAPPSRLSRHPRRCPSPDAIPRVGAAGRPERTVVPESRAARRGTMGDVLPRARGSGFEERADGLGPATEDGARGATPRHAHARDRTEPTLRRVAEPVETDARRLHVLGWPGSS